MCVNSFVKFLILIRLINCYSWPSNYYKPNLNHNKVNFNIGAVLEPNHIAQFFQAVEDINQNSNISIFLKAEGLPIVNNPVQILHEFCKSIISQEVFVVIINDASSSEANVISQTCNFFSIPVFGLSNRENSLFDKHMNSVYLRIIPPYSQQIVGWIEILKTLNYSKVNFIYGADYDGRNTFTQFELLAEKNGIQINSAIEYQNELTDVFQELEAYDAIQCRVFLLYANEADAESIFLEASKFNMTTSGYVWIVSELSLKAKNVPEGVISLRLYNATNVFGHLKDSLTVISKAINELYLNENITKPPSYCGDLSNSKWDTGIILYNYIKKQVINYAQTGQIEFDSKGDRINADYEIINIIKGKANIVGHYAFVYPTNQMQLDLKLSEIIWPGNQLIKPLNYVRPSHVLVVTLEEEPFIWAKKVNDSQSCVLNQIPCPRYDNQTGLEKMYCCYGYCIDFLIELSNRLNFTYTLYQVSDGAYGNLVHVNGTDYPKQWTGLVGDLISKKADMIVAPLTINQERSLFIEFSNPFKYQGITILEKKQPRRATLVSFLQPFEESLWLLVMVSVHIVALALYLLDRFSPFGRYRLPNCDVTEEDALNLSSAIWFAWGVLLNSGIGEGAPRSFSGRVLGMVWAGFAMIVIASYTANLAAFLVLDRPETSLSGINDPRLRNPSENFIYATVLESATEMYFKRQIELNAMYRHMQGRNFPNVEEAVLAVKSEKISAFIWDSTRLEYEASKDCDLMTATEQFGHSGYGIGLQKNSLWTEQVNMAILTMHESGFMEDLDQKWILQGTIGKCMNHMESAPTTLGLKSMAGVFLLVGAGIVGGIGLILIELVYKKRQTKQQRQLEAARNASEKWKKFVEKRRMHRNNLYQIRKEQIKQQQLFEKQYETEKKKKRNSFGLKTFLNHVLENYETEHFNQSKDKNSQNNMSCGQSSKEVFYFNKESKLKKNKNENFWFAKENQNEQKHQTKSEVTKRKILTREDAFRPTTPDNVYFFSEPKLESPSKSLKQSFKLSSKTSPQVYDHSIQYDNFG